LTDRLFAKDVVAA